MLKVFEIKLTKSSSKNLLYFISLLRLNYSRVQPGNITFKTWRDSCWIKLVAVVVVVLVILIIFLIFK